MEAVICAIRPAPKDAQIRDSLRTHYPDGVVSWHTGAGELKRLLETPHPNDPIFVFIARDSDDFRTLFTMQSEVTGRRHLLIMDTSRSELATLAHRLHPRVVLDLAEAAGLLPFVLARMGCSRPAAKPQATPHLAPGFAL